MTGDLSLEISRGNSLHWGPAYYCTTVLHYSTYTVVSTVLLSLFRRQSRPVRSRSPTVAAIMVEGVGSPTASRVPTVWLGWTFRDDRKKGWMHVDWGSRFC